MSDLPLHQVTHWRKIKEYDYAIGNYEGINLKAYDLDHMTAYETSGLNLKGKNVTYCNSKTNQSCWVSNNDYAVYEAPAKSNSDKYKFCGDFLILAYNKSFDFWYFGTMKNNIDYAETRKNKKLVEKTRLRVYGQYTVTVGTGRSGDSISKVVSGSGVTYGGNSHTNKDFDNFSTRKKAYCKKTNSEVLGEILGNKSSIKNAIDTKAVEIYKKKPRKKK